jgi:hypothetical protein
VAFSGRTLARDLSAPALQARWDARATALPGGPTGDTMRALVDALAAAAQAGTGTPLATLRGQIAVAADALWAAADAVEADRGGMWHTAAGEAARAAREPGQVDRTSAGGLLGVLAELGGLPPARSKDESDLRKAWALWQRLMRIWTRLEQGENARVAAATVATVTTLTGVGARQARPTTTTPAAAAPATSRRRVRPGDSPDTITRSGA